MFTDYTYRDNQSENKQCYVLNYKYKMKLPIRINLIKILSHRHAQRFILMLVLNPIKLTLCPRILPCRKRLIRWELLHYWGLRRFWSTVLSTAPMVWNKPDKHSTTELHHPSSVCFPQGPTVLSLPSKPVFTFLSTGSHRIQVEGVKLVSCGVFFCFLQ